MECPQCGFDNREGIKFCEECGSKMELVCHSCGAKVPLGRRFCGECGQNLLQPVEPVPKDLSFDEKLAKIQKYLPSGLTEKILSQRDRIEGERRHVTIMFVDMKGFTPLTEKLGPEGAFALMDQVFEILIRKVHDFEGTVNEIRGDGLLALFGAPIALEDGPQRAIRSSLAIHRELVRFSDKVKAEKQILPILVRIGINTGPVVVGTLGNDLRLQFTAVGDTINMAARMEQIAEPGTTYVTEDTFKLTEGFFRFEALGEKRLKGKEEPLKVYRVIAPSSRRTRFDVSAERGLTRFIGRERELELLIDSFDRAKSGRGQAVSIVGEAGVGKSRLLYEFRKAVANENVTFLEGKCLSYGRGAPYHPFIDVLKANFDLREADGDGEIRDKVKRGLGILGVDETSTLPYILELLSVKDSGIEKIQMSPEGKRDKIIEAIKGIALKGSELRPLVLAFEDLHWMDSSSESVSKYLLESIPGARVLLILSFRPDFLQTWGAKSFHSRVNLNRLSNRESLAMVADLLDTHDMTEDLEELILEKTEGVPFFIEELVRSLKDLRVIERRDNRCGLVQGIDLPTIPSSIQDLIMVRVDSLPEGPKEVLQAGSVIEREFSYDLIRAVTGLSEQELLTRLSILKDAELVYERGIYPECTYVFKHSLTREVVYDSILTGRKKKLHKKIGNAIEEFYNDNIDEQYAVLAEHYIEAEHWDEAAEFSRLARKKAIKTASINDAIAHTRKTVASFARLRQTDDVEKKVIDARTVLGLLYLQSTHFIEAKEAVDPIVALALKHNYRKRLCQIFTVVSAHSLFVEEDFPQTLKHLEEARSIAKQESDPLSLFFVNFWLGYALSLACEFERASYNFEQALKINMEANNLWGVSALKSQMSWLAYLNRGNIDLAYETSRDAMSMAEHSADMFSRSVAHVCRGISYHGKRSLEEAIRHLSKGVDLSERQVFSYVNAAGHTYLGETYSEMAHYQKSRDHYDKATDLLKQHRSFPALRNLNTTGSSMARVMNNDRDIDLESLYNCVSENKWPVFEGWIRRHLSEILLNIDNRHTTEAQHWIEEAITADERNGMRFHLARDYAVFAELFRRQKDTLKAREHLGKAIDLYKECGADGWVTKAKEELATMQ